MLLILQSYCVGLRLALHNVGMQWDFSQPILVKKNAGDVTY